MMKRCNPLRPALIVVSAAMLFGGCGPSSGGMWYFLTQPKEKVPAEFRLPAGPLAVLVDDPLGQMEVGGMQNALAEAVGERLTAFRAHERMVPAERLDRLRRLDPDYESLPVRQVGERVGADVVLYVLVTRCRLQDVPDSDLYQGQLSARVKVIDAKAKPGDVVRLWPREQDGRLIDISLPQRTGSGDAVRRDVADELVNKSAKTIARLFCDYEIDPQNPDA
jgi:hypothetical protein